MKSSAYVLLLLLLASLSPFAMSGADVIHVYGPGGPAPAMKEAAAAFEKSSGVKVEVTAGPTPQWLDKALADGDVIYSGAENMMTSFVRAMKGEIVEETIRPLYMRPSTILVRPGNPKKLRGIHDLMKPGVKILVVEGAGQIGLWEDVVGRLGEINMIRRFRSNIVASSSNSGEAKELWTKDPTIDAWLIWNIWEIANDELADSVAVEPDLRIWRDCGVGLTKRGNGRAAARKFVDYLESKEGRTIFERWGWK